MRADSSARRSWQDERGQTFVFVLSILFALFLIVAMSVNIGQAVNRRIMLQIAADAGAFTGASEMARGMNTIAEVNLRIQRAWAAMATALVGFNPPGPPCFVSDLATESYAVARWNFGQLIRMVNLGYGQRAGGEARRVTEYNALDMFPFERLQMGESDAESGIARRRPAAYLVDLEDVPHGTRPDVASPAPGYRVRTWACWIPGLPPVFLPRQQTFSLWLRARPSSMPIEFAWVVKAPRRRARMFDAFFGPYAVPEMTAAALAKPVGGEIRRGQTRYVAKMLPLRAIRGSVYDPFFGRARSVHH